jgi:DNA-binding XRE family transcriptional regulator
MAGRTAPEPIRPFRLDFTPLKRIRGYNLLTRAQLARAAGVDPVTIWRLENNRHKASPSFMQVVALARALSVPIHELFIAVDQDAV